MIKRFALSILAGAAIAAMPAQAAPEPEYIDSSSMQVIEKIDGNIVTFKDSQGQSRDYYVPTWMFSKYDLKVGTSATLYNKNVTQGIYKSGYIEVTKPGVPETPEVFAVHNSRKECTSAESPASVGLKSGSRVWYKPECCLATIPVVGAMSFYVKKEIVVERSEPPTVPPAPAPAPAPAPVPRTW
jgi:hypothetical protein